MHAVRSMRFAGLFAMCAVVLLTSPVPSECQTVTYNYANHVNFSELKTYEWVTIEGASATDPQVDVDIRAAIDAQLAARKIMKAAQNAQLLIGYQISDARRIPITMLAGYYQYGPGWSYATWYGYSRGFVIEDPSTLSTENGMDIQFGHLVLDAYDARYRDLVWRGRVTRALSFDQDYQKRSRQLNRAITKLVQTFPRAPRLD